MDHLCHSLSVKILDPQIIMWKNVDVFIVACLACHLCRRYDCILQSGIKECWGRWTVGNSFYLHKFLLTMCSGHTRCACQSFQGLCLPVDAFTHLFAITVLSFGAQLTYWYEFSVLYGGEWLLSTRWPTCGPRAIYHIVLFCLRPNLWIVCRVYVKCFGKLQEWDPPH